MACRQLQQAILHDANLDQEQRQVRGFQAASAVQQHGQLQFKPQELSFDLSALHCWYAGHMAHLTG
jgi:hypothetical protein